MVNLSLYSIKAVILLDAEGNRVLAKYYGGETTTLKQQKQFEKGLFDKTKRAQGESVVWMCERRMHSILMRGDVYCKHRRGYFIRQSSGTVPLKYRHFLLRCWFYGGE